MAEKQKLEILPNYEWAYTVVERKGESWQGNFSGNATIQGTSGRGGDGAIAKAGKASPGRITGGLVVAATEQEAKRKIAEIHGQKCEIKYLDKRGMVL
jgi:hypothetical protein